MALFNEKEAGNLALMTKSAQVNSADLQEVATFTVREATSLDGFMDTSIHRAYRAEDWEAFRPVATALRLQQRLIQSAGEDRSVAPNNQHLLDHLLNEWRPVVRYGSQWEGMVEGDGDAEYYPPAERIPLTAVFPIMEDEDGDAIKRFAFTILDTIREKLDEVRKGQDVFAQCPVCNHYYQRNPARRSHLYCSERCSQTGRKRNIRHQKRVPLKNVLTEGHRIK